MAKTYLVYRAMLGRHDIAREFCESLSLHSQNLFSDLECSTKQKLLSECFRKTSNAECYLSRNLQHKFYRSQKTLLVQTRSKQGYKPYKILQPEFIFNNEHVQKIEK